MTALAEKQHLVAKVGALKSGASMTFTLANPGTYDGATGVFTGDSSTTVVGVGRIVLGDAKRYDELHLVQSEALTVAFVPDTRGESPALLSTVSISSTTYTVRDVVRWAPDGTTNTCTVIVSR